VKRCILDQAVVKGPLASFINFVTNADMFKAQLASIGVDISKMPLGDIDQRTIDSGMEALLKLETEYKKKSSVSANWYKFCPGCTLVVRCWRLLAVGRSCSSALDNSGFTTLPLTLTSALASQVLTPAMCLHESCRHVRQVQHVRQGGAPLRLEKTCHKMEQSFKHRFALLPIIGA
jgi:hypothetical protein